MTNQLTLYHYWRSSCSWRVRWGLELKGLSYTSKTVNLLQNEQQSAAYLKVNPFGHVPALVVNQETLSDSMAILEWLDETYPQAPILPQDIASKTKVRELAYIVSSGIQPIQNLKVMKFISNDQKERVRFSAHFIAQGLKVFEEKIQQTAGTYSFGGQVTLADLCLIPQVYNAHRFKIDMNQFPVIQRIYSHCIQTPECHKAAPEQQPGAQP